ncbi:RNA polymerase II elongation factor [Coelomomyces lativittatus]|nr:RNA polymerase II elongation factor [Coelomomyces lativittatus]
MNSNSLTVTKPVSPTSILSESKSHPSALTDASSPISSSAVPISSSSLSLNSDSKIQVHSNGSFSPSTSTSLSDQSNGFKNTFPERSVTIDQVNIVCTGNPTRNKCIEMLYNALCVNTLESSELILQKSSLLERSLLNKHQGQVTSQYRADVRMFYANLKHKQNFELREAMISGQLSMSTFINMTPAEMAPGSLKKEIEEMKKVNLFLARAAGNTKAETDLFKCNKCKKRRTSYYQLQTRSADEPMTTFVECLECTFYLSIFPFLFSILHSTSNHFTKSNLLLQCITSHSKEK